PLSAPASAMQGYSGASGQDQRRGGDRNGRGRRSRRGRGQKGGGRALPDSKFYSPGAAESRPEPPPIAQSAGRMEAAAPAEAAAREPESRDMGARQTRPDDFFVLPGESLAKYTRPGEEDLGEEAPAAARMDISHKPPETVAAAV